MPKIKQFLLIFEQNYLKSKIFIVIFEKWRYEYNVNLCNFF